MRQAYHKQPNPVCGTRAGATVSLALASVAFLAGCQPMLGRSPNQVPVAAYPTDSIADAQLNAMQPAAGPAAPAAAPAGYPAAAGAGLAYPNAYQGYGSPAFAALESNQMELKQRLERIEQALLRLDRRMQLVERNELNRMEGGGASYQAPQASPSEISGNITMPQAPLAQTVRQALRSPEAWGGDTAEGVLAAQPTAIPAAAPYAEGFAPVSQVDSTIRSTLQAAPRLPSLADQAPTAQGRIPQSAGNMAIWTVRYEPEKVWPDRTQLPASRAVVELLRKSETATLVARGPKPTSPEFQERVRALSRYLAKVSALETVPISTMPMSELDSDTIELLATP